MVRALRDRRRTRAPHHRTTGFGATDRWCGAPGAECPRSPPRPHRTTAPPVRCGGAVRWCGRGRFRWCAVLRRTGRTRTAPAAPRLGCGVRCGGQPPRRQARARSRTPPPGSVSATTERSGQPPLSGKDPLVTTPCPVSGCPLVQLDRRPGHPLVQGPVCTLTPLSGVWPHPLSRSAPTAFLLDRGHLPPARRAPSLVRCPRPRRRGVGPAAAHRGRDLSPRSPSASMPASLPLTALGREGVVQRPHRTSRTTAPHPGVTAWIAVVRNGDRTTAPPHRISAPHPVVRCGRGRRCGAAPPLSAHRTAPHPLVRAPLVQPDRIGVSPGPHRPRKSIRPRTRGVRRA